MSNEKIVAQLIEDEAEFAGLEFRKDYSGRGMYGKTCIGVVGDFTNFLRLILSVKESCDAKDIIGIDGVLEEVEMDSMGMDTIFYWPDLERGWD